MSIQQMFDSASAVVKEHNSVIGEGKSGCINLEQFLENIKLSGGTTVERLKALSYEDILACIPYICNFSIKPVAIAKDIAKIFRGKEETKVENRPVSAKKAEKMSLLELVQSYDPEEDNAVSQRLKDISRNEPFIVFFSGRTVDVESSLNLLKEVKQGYEGRQTTLVNCEQHEVYRVGGLPDNFVEENPLYRNRPLRPDGTCDQTGRSWNGISMNIRQLVRIAMDIDGTPVSIDKAHQILDLVMSDEPWKKLVLRYGKAAVEYKKLEGMGKLPVLKLSLKKGGSESTNPFQQVRK